MNTILRAVDRFFEKNPALLAALIGVRPHQLRPDADESVPGGGQWAS